MDRRQFLASTAAAGAVGLAPSAADALQATGAVGNDAALNAAFDQVFKTALAYSPELATSLGFDKEGVESSARAARDQLADSVFSEPEQGWSGPRDRNDVENPVRVFDTSFALIARSEPDLG